MSESVPLLFDASVERFDRRPAIQYFCKEMNAFVTKDWRDLSASVGALANALLSLSIEPGERIGLLAMTRPEWVISDISIMKASGVVVPIYHSSLVDQIAYIISDANIRIIFVEDEAQLIKVRQVQETSGHLYRIIVFDGIGGGLRPNEIYLADFVEDRLGQCESSISDPKSLASLVYTSGTTGEPKGAMISHDNLLYEAQAIDRLGVLGQDDVQLIFLPLAHIFARVLMLSWIRTGHLLAFARSIEQVIEDMAIIKPTFMAGVPRIFEKVRAKTRETALASGRLKAFLARAAFDEADRLSEEGQSAGLKTRFLKKLVFDKVGKRLRDRLGGRIRFLVSGGAQLSPQVFTFFELCGIPLCEGYGLTETTAATCLNLPWAMKRGTVGRAVPGTEVRLNSDGEIIVRGRGVFLGFWRKEKDTDQVLQDDGWFHTGDIGEIDNGGFVKIIDRKREIIVTSQGKNIAPQRVENLIKAKSPIIAQAVVIGDRRPYLTALIALDVAHARSILADSAIGDRSTVSELSAHAAIFDEVKNAIAAANSSLANFEQVKRFHILDREFVVGEELTPTLKVKRKECMRKFSKEIEQLYA